MKKDLQQKSLKENLWNAKNEPTKNERKKEKRSQAKYLKSYELVLLLVEPLNIYNIFVVVDIM